MSPPQSQTVTASRASSFHNDTRRQVGDKWVTNESASVTGSARDSETEIAPMQKPEKRHSDTARENRERIRQKLQARTQKLRIGKLETTVSGNRRCGNLPIL